MDQSLYEIMIEQLRNLEEPELFGIDQEEVPGLQTVLSEDTEKERFFTVKEKYLEADEHGFPVIKEVAAEYPTWIFNGTPFWTNPTDPVWEGWSGLAPYLPAPKAPSIISIEGGEQAADEDRSAAGFMPEDQSMKKFYSAARTWKPQERHFHNWVAAVAKADKSRASRLWRALWAKYYSRKEDGTLKDWLFSYHITMIKDLFDRIHGIKSKKERAK